MPNSRSRITNNLLLMEKMEFHLNSSIKKSVASLFQVKPRFFEQERFKMRSHRKDEKAIELFVSLCVSAELNIFQRLINLFTFLIMGKLPILAFTRIIFSEYDEMYSMELF